MNVLITGGAGFIGSHLCDYLITDHNVTALDNLSLGRKSNIEHLFHKENFKFIEADMNNSSMMDEVFAIGKFDRIYHLAANSDIAQSHAKPSIDFKNTFLTTYNLLECMKNHNVKEIIFASSSAIYGETQGPIDEDYGPLKPISHYGAAKLSSEGFITSFVKNYEMQAWILRFPNVVGERTTHGVIFDFINKLRKDNTALEVLGDGEQYKPYLYVKDLVKAIILVSETTSEPVNIYNVGVNSRTKVRDIAKFVIRAMQLNSKIEYTGNTIGWVGDVPQFSYNLSKINKLGWKAQVTSDEAVQKSINYILQNKL
ncbi:MAG: NAD-dependent epimerase/dehydratase family protein [Rhizobiales bacterium]|nr:NAD-dependent epimerase/dehydratase family protein [Hyphomicrobiales bacterium]